jgi:hypothetical protein
MDTLQIDLIIYICNWITPYEKINIAQSNNYLWLSLKKSIDEYRNSCQLWNTQLSSFDFIFTDENLIEDDIMLCSFNFSKNTSMILSETCINSLPYLPPIPNTQRQCLFGYYDIIYEYNHCEFNDIIQIITENDNPINFLLDRSIHIRNSMIHKYVSENSMIQINIKRLCLVLTNIRRKFKQPHSFCLFFNITHTNKSTYHICPLYFTFINDTVYLIDPESKNIIPDDIYFLNFPLLMNFEHFH